MAYMAAALGLTFVVVALAAWPIGCLLWTERYGLDPSPMETAGIVAGVTLASAASVVATMMARRWGIAALARIGE
jgi:hypothetical protein